jgi:type 1 fimbria pilin
MRKFAIILGLVLTFSALFASGRTAAGRHPITDSSSFSGEIMDKACADMGSHDMMMKKEGAKTAKECALQCVKAGSTLVLYDASRNVVYQLDDQSKATEFAGQKVTVKGTYDDSTKTIHVDSISAKVSTAGI